MGEDKIDLLTIISAHAEAAYYSSKEVEIITNSLRAIVDQALHTEDRVILQACAKLGLLENR